jgi:hypothetical protein
MGLVFDKKQLPQVIVLGALSAGLLGYFTMKMITPPPTQAAASPGSSSLTPSPGAPSAAAGQPEDNSPDVSALLGAAAPTDVMRDPFTPCSEATAEATVAAATSAPKPPPPPAGSEPVSPLPGIGQVMPLGVGAAKQPASWAVTGIVCSDQNPGDSLAIFRSGDERRYVRLGEMVDSTTRLIGIDRDGVTIQKDNNKIRIALGAPPTPPAPTAALATVAGVPGAAPAVAAATASGTPGATALPAIPNMQAAPGQVAAAAPAVATPTPNTPQMAPATAKAPPGLPTF